MLWRAGKSSRCTPPHPAVWARLGPPTPREPPHLAAAHVARVAAAALRPALSKVGQQLRVAARRLALAVALHLRGAVVWCAEEGEAGARAA